MGFYRKKPVIVEAWPTGVMGGGYGRDTATIKERIISEGGKAAYRWEGGDLILSITTLEGNMDVSPGDWVIRGVNGEFYPCKPEIFEKTYDPANPVEDATRVVDGEPKYRPQRYWDDELHGTQGPIGGDDAT